MALVSRVLHEICVTLIWSRADPGGVRVFARRKGDVDSEIELIQPTTHEVSVRVHNLKRAKTDPARRVSPLSDGRFLPGWGQAGHSTAHSPSEVAATPPGSLPLPARLNILRFVHMLTMLAKAS